MKYLNSSAFTTDPAMLSGWYRTSLTRKGVVLSVHGLNNHPRIMNDLAQFLNQLGYDVLNIALIGHRGSLEEMKTATYPLLHEHTRLHLCELVTKAQQEPIIFLGYSTGAILQGNLLYQLPQLREHPLRVIWLAPAFQLRLASRLIHLLKGPWVLPSLNIKPYRANHGTSLNAYAALSYGRKKFRASFTADPNLMPPTLIIMDPMDELVSWPLSLQFFSDLPQVQLAPISNHDSTLSGKRHHLIIDRKSLGRSGWNHLTLLIQDFLDQSP